MESGCASPYRCVSMVGAEDVVSSNGADPREHAVGIHVAPRVVSSRSLRPRAGGTVPGGRDTPLWARHASASDPVDDG